MCQEVPGDVTITTLLTDISTDIYRMTGMFAPIEVNTPASIVTCEVNSRVAPFVCSPVIRTLYVPGAKLGSRTTDEKDPLVSMVPSARVTTEGDTFDTEVTVSKYVDVTATRSAP
jgi:hypothetical protein